MPPLIRPRIRGSATLQDGRLRFLLAFPAAAPSKQAKGVFESHLAAGDRRNWLFRQPTVKDHARAIDVVRI